MLYFTPTADTFWENFDLPDATFSLIRHSSGSRVNTLGNVDIRLIYQGVLFFLLTPTPDTVWELDENFGETLIFGRHIFSFPSDTVW